MLRKPGLGVWVFVACLSAPPVFALDRDIKVVANLEQASGKTTGIYHALIVGIDDYEDPEIDKLKTAVADARATAEVLKSQYGFTDVTLLLDRQATAAAIEKTLRRLTLESGENDSVLIYYAGHGDEDKLTGSGWWVPANAKGGEPSSYMENGIIQKYVKAMKARHVLVVADSCFSGTLFGEARTLPPITDKFYADLYKNKSRWGMTSGSKTRVSDSGVGGHSIFAYHFLKELQENKGAYLTPRDIYQRIGPAVRNNSEQLPLVKPIKNAGDENGEFVFIRMASLGATTAPQKEMVPPPPPIPQAPSAVVLQGHLQVNVNVPGSKVTVDGAYKGTISPGKPLNLQNLPTGTVTVRVEAAGYETLERSASIQRGQWTQEVFELQPAQTAALPPQTKEKSGSTSAGMVKIPGGTFYAGLQGESDNPVRELEIGTFSIDKYEVTQSEFQQVMGDNPSAFKGDNLPVDSVTWHKADAYCRKVGKRLPTEWEWEKAAKGGSRTKFHWGDNEGDAGRYTWFSENADNHTHPVGQKKPNQYGLYDMAGNVWEWTASDYDNSGNKVLRGGSWGFNPGLTRPAARGSLGPGDRGLNYGFRCVQ